MQSAPNTSPSSDQNSDSAPASQQPDTPSDTCTQGNCSQTPIDSNTGDQAPPASNASNAGSPYPMSDFSPSTLSSQDQLSSQSDVPQSVIAPASAQDAQVAPSAEFAEVPSNNPAAPDLFSQVGTAISTAASDAYSAVTDAAASAYGSVQSLFATSADTSPDANTGAGSSPAASDANYVSPESAGGLGNSGALSAGTLSLSDVPSSEFSPSNITNGLLDSQSPQNQPAALDANTIEGSPAVTPSAEAAQQSQLNSNQQPYTFLSVPADQLSNQGSINQPGASTGLSTNADNPIWNDFTRSTDIEDRRDDDISSNAAPTYVMTPAESAQAIATYMAAQLEYFESTEATQLQKDLGYFNIK